MRERPLAGARDTIDFAERAGTQPVFFTEEALEKFAQSGAPLLILAHGTFDGGPIDEKPNGEVDLSVDRWWHKDGNFTKTIAARCQNLGIQNISFDELVWPFDEENILLEPGTRFPLKEYGPNSEFYRRESGVQFSYLLSDLEQKNAALVASGRRPIEYFLIGHSHGGSVVHHALKNYVEAGGEFPHLRGWMTVGTPFIHRSIKLTRGWASGVQKWMPPLAGVAAVATATSLIGGGQVLRQLLEVGGSSDYRGNLIAFLVLLPAALAFFSAGYAVGMLISWLVGPLFYHATSLAMWVTLRLPLPRSFINLAMTALSRGERRRLRIPPLNGRWINRTLEQRRSLRRKWVGVTHPFDEAVGLLRAVVEFREDVLRPKRTRLSILNVAIFAGLLYLLDDATNNFFRDSAVRFFEWMLSTDLTRDILAGVAVSLGVAFLLSFFRSARNAIAGPLSWIDANIIGIPAKISRAIANRFLKRSIRDIVTGSDVADAHEVKVFDSPLRDRPCAQLPEYLVQEISAINAGALHRNAGSVGRLMSRVAETGGNLNKVMKELQSEVREGVLIHSAYFRSAAFADLVAAAMVAAFDDTGELTQALREMETNNPRIDENGAAYRPLHWLRKNSPEIFRHKLGDNWRYDG